MKIRFGTEAVEEAVAKLDESDKELAAIGKDFGRVDRAQMKWHKAIPPELPFPIFRHTHNHNTPNPEPFEREYQTNPRQAAQILQSDIGNLHRFIEQLVSQRQAPEIVKTGEALVGELESLLARFRDAERENEKATKAVFDELQALRAVVAKYWWEKREDMFAEIREALAPFCSSPENLKQTANVCSGPEVLFARFVRYSERYSPLKGVINYPDGPGAAATSDHGRKFAENLLREVRLIEANS